MKLVITGENKKNKKVLLISEDSRYSSIFSADIDFKNKEIRILSKDETGYIEEFKKIDGIKINF